MTPYLPIVEVGDTVCGSPLHYLVGWCCEPCAVGLDDLGGRVYLRKRSGLLQMTSSHKWGSCYFPLFLLIVHGLLYGPGEGMWLPTHYRETDQFSMMFWGIGIVRNREGVLRCSFNLSLKVLEDSPIYSSLHFILSHLYLCINPLFCMMLSLALGVTMRLLMVLHP